MDTARIPQRNVTYPKELAPCRASNQPLRAVRRRTATDCFFSLALYPTTCFVR